MGYFFEKLWNCWYRICLDFLCVEISTVKPSARLSSLTKEGNILFTFLRVMGLFFRSEAPGLVFSVTYP
jgi:hypothetical protein